MSFMVWTDELNTGIDVIDGQHRRIVDMINALHDTAKGKERTAIGNVIEELVDYTMSHFAFEESLMEEAGYQYVKPHKKVHELFIKRVSEYKMRFAAGEDIAEELNNLLSRWLFNHIKHDDGAYVGAVKGQMQAVVTQSKQEGGWLSKAMKRFF
jgi:hemerythrin